MKKIIFPFFVGTMTLFGIQSNDIEFIGLQSISKEKMIAFLMEQNQTLTTTTIKQGLDKFNFIQTLSVDENNGKIIVKLQEKPSISNFEFVGFSNDLEEKLSSMLSKNTYFIDDIFLKEIQTKVERYLSDEGFVDIELSLKTIKNNENSSKVILTLDSYNLLVVNNVTFNGSNKQYTRELEKVIKTQPKSMFPWFYGQSNGLLKRKALEDDVRKIYNFYVDNGYLDVEVNTPSLIIKENDVEVGFNIKEGKPYFMKEYEITPKDFNLNDFDKETKEIGLLTKITKEERFSLTKTKNIVEEIQKLFKDRGYYNTSITVTPQKNAQSVVVVLEITLKNKYQIKNVLITGNTKTLDRVVRRNVLLQPGMTYSETLLADSILKMKRTGIIGNPKIKAINVEDNNLDLLVEVNELKTGAFLMGGGYGTETGFNINGVVTEKNLFGSGLNVGLNANLSKISKSYSFSFLNPALFDSDFSFGTAITKSNLQTGIDLTKVKQDNQNIKMMFGYNVNKYLSMNLNTIMEQVDTTYLFFNNQIKYTKNSIGYGVTFDNTVGIPFPRKGSFIDNTIEYSGFGGDVVTVRDFFTTKYFYDTSDLLGIDSILRYKFSIGSIKYYAGSTLLDGYALGGIGSVRGYEDYAVGIVGFGEEGYNRTMLNSVELSFDLFGIPNLRTGIFYDNGTLGKNKFFDLTKQSFGVNLEWYSPIGPVQFVVANPINTNKTDRTSKVGFSIGRQF